MSVSPVWRSHDLVLFRPRHNEWRREEGWVQCTRAPVRCWGPRGQAGYFSIGRNTHTHIRLMAFCPGLPGWAGTRKVKPIWILLKQETVSGNGISWAICKSAPRSRLITTPAPHHSVFYRPDALPAAQTTASKHWKPRIGSKFNKNPVEWLSISHYATRESCCPWTRHWAQPQLHHVTKLNCNSHCRL